MTGLPVNINLFAVLLAGMTYFALAMIWFHPAIFGKAWFINGHSEEGHGPGELAAAVAWDVVLSLVLAFGIAYGMEMIAATGLGMGLLSGFGFGLLLYAVLAIPHYLMAVEPLRVLTIDRGFTLFGTTLIGGIIGYMG